MKAREALREGAAALSGSETPFLDASLLLAAALGLDRAALLAAGPEELGQGELDGYRRALRRRSEGLPLAYILGYKEFWGRRIAVDPRVLIPRADTETLVEAALKLGDTILRERAKEANVEPNTESTEHTESAEEGTRGAWKGRKRSNTPKGFSSFSLSPFSSPRPPHLRDLRVESFGSHSRLRVHECCTGSGCVALSLAADRPEWEVSASDISVEALEVAAANARSILGPGLGSLGRPGGALSLSRSDLLSGIGGEFDLIVANPPYVATEETSRLLERGWSEPRLALDGGGDGLELLRRLPGEAARVLAPGGALLVEADGAQALAVAELFRASRFAGIENSRDLSGVARVTSGRKTWTS